MTEPVEQRVIALMSACDRAVAERRDSDALKAFREATTLLPEHPLVLHEQARRALLAGDVGGAVALLERVVQSVPKHLPFWMTYAAALRVLVRHEDELNALERALALDPRNPFALMQKATALDRLGKRRSAAKVYLNVLKIIGTDAARSPQLQKLAQEARLRAEEGGRELGEYLDARMKPLRAERGQAGFTRFDRSIDALVGRRRIYWPQPTFMLFPYLRHVEFFERADFPWLADIEAATPAIRDELLGLLAEDHDGVEPYVQYGQGTPLAQWSELNHSKRWGAYFLWKEGTALPDHIARAPITAAAVSAAPQVDVPGFSPTAFFSILEPRTRIPPHTGVTNTRAIVHLPLVVPPGCGFRVGGDSRQWGVGEAWVFDDTIEHEAWNDSDTLRAILIFDIWNPQLTLAERDLVRESTRALAEYYAEEGVPEFAL